MKLSTKSGSATNRPMFKEVLQSRFTTVLLAFAIIFFAASLIKTIPDFSIVLKENNSLNQKIAESQKEKSELENSADFFKSAAYLEQQVRLKLNYKKPGENVVYIYSNNSQPAGDAQAPAPSIWVKAVVNLEIWWQDLLGMFKK